MRLRLFSVLICCSLFCKSQDDSLNVTFEHVRELGLVFEYSQRLIKPFSQTGKDWLRMSPYCNWRTKNGNQWVLNWNRFDAVFKRSDDIFTPDYFDAELGKSLQYNVLIGGRKDKSFYPKIGIESQFNLSYYMSVPHVSSSFKRWDFRAILGQNLSFGFVTRGKRLTTNVSVGMNFIEAAVTVLRTDNPQVPIRNRTQGIISIDLPIYRLYSRWGIAYIL